jgi:hypothetical protein
MKPQHCGEIECFRAAPNQERPLLAHSGHPNCIDECLLSAVKWTWRTNGPLCRLMTQSTKTLVSAVASTG